MLSDSRLHRDGTKKSNTSGRQKIEQNRCHQEKVGREMLGIKRGPKRGRKKCFQLMWMWLQLCILTENHSTLRWGTNISLQHDTFQDTSVPSLILVEWTVWNSLSEPWNFAVYGAMVNLTSYSMRKNTSTVVHAGKFAEANVFVGNNDAISRARRIGSPVEPVPNTSSYAEVLTHSNREASVTPRKADEDDLKLADDTLKETTLGSTKTWILLVKECLRRKRQVFMTPRFGN